MGRMFFNVLATFAEFEADLLSLRTRERMLVAKAKGRLKGKPPKLSATQQAHLIKLLEAGEHTVLVPKERAMRHRCCLSCSTRWTASTKTPTSCSY